MNYLETLTKLKQAVSTARYEHETPEYQHLAVTSSLDTIESLVNELLRERQDE